MLDAFRKECVDGACDDALLGGAWVPGASGFANLVAHGQGLCGHVPMPATTSDDRM